jgi:hypothetical protein
MLTIIQLLSLPLSLKLGEIRKPDATGKAKSRAFQQVKSVLGLIGSPPQQALAVSTALTRSEQQDIGKALGIVASSDQTRQVADRCLAAIKEAVQHPGVLKTQTKDSLLFQRMLLWAIVPAVVAKDAPAEVKKAFCKEVSETVAALGMSKVRSWVQKTCTQSSHCVTEELRRSNFSRPFECRETWCSLSFNT